MSPQNSRRNIRCYWRFNDRRYRIGFRGAVGKQQDMASFKNRCQSHGNSVRWNILGFSKKARVIFARKIGKKGFMRATVKRSTGLAKTDMAVFANTQNLQVYAATDFYLPFINRAFLNNIGSHSIGNKDV